MISDGGDGPLATPGIPLSALNCRWAGPCGGPLDGLLMPISFGPGELFENCRLPDKG